MLREKRSLASTFVGLPKLIPLTIHSPVLNIDNNTDLPPATLPQSTPNPTSKLPNPKPAPKQSYQLPDPIQT